MVKIKYGEPYKTSFGKAKESIKAKTLGQLMEKIAKKYEGKEYANTVKDSSMIRLNNKDFLNREEDLEYKLIPKDEILIMMIISGG